MGFKILKKIKKGICIVRENKKCSTCKWCQIDELKELICVNSNSEYVADYADKTHCCEDYEPKV